MSAVRVLELARIDAADLAGLLDRRPWTDPEVLVACRDIVAAVRARGDAALVEYTRRFDGVDLAPADIAVSPEEAERAAAGLAPEVRRALDTALDHVQRFHAGRAPGPMQLLEVAPGIWCGERVTPIDSVCLYVPRGRGSFASVACMLGVPASLAGVASIVLCTPPGPGGEIDAATMHVARKLRIDRVFRVGGAQAIAAVAFGTESVPRCDKVLGPGNVFVSAARHILADTIDPGPPAGPSESLIVADASADPANAAWNLMIEAEHGENSCAVLATHERRLAEAVAGRVADFKDTLPPRRREFVERVLVERGGIVVTASLAESIDFANRFAPEHLALMVEQPWEVLPRVRNAGEILLGDYPIFSLANYAMGVNAILPTGGWARSCSGIAVSDFCKRTSVGFVTRVGYRALREVVPPLSRDEGFSAHHEAVLRWREP